jgi:hypothetical protein
VDESGAVGGQVRDETAIDQVDEIAREAKFDWVAAQEEKDRECSLLGHAELFVQIMTGKERIARRGGPRTLSPGESVSSLGQELQVNETAVEKRVATHERISEKNIQECPGSAVLPTSPTGRVAAPGEMS